MSLLKSFRTTAPLTRPVSSIWKALANLHHLLITRSLLHFWLRCKFAHSHSASITTDRLGNIPIWSLEAKLNHQGTGARGRSLIQRVQTVQTIQTLQPTCRHPWLGVLEKLVFIFFTGLWNDSLSWLVLQSSWKVAKLRWFVAIANKEALNSKHQNHNKGHVKLTEKIRKGQKGQEFY